MGHLGERCATAEFHNHLPSPAGVVHAPPETPDERFKVNVYILGPTLRADGIRISIFRQTRSGGVWSDAAVNAEMTTEFENAVLSRARDLRLRAVAEKD